MKKGLLTLLLLIAYPLLASHIVGGEFELLHLSGNQYQLNMILYFDLKNGSAAAKDASVTAVIYRKSDNFLMTSVFLQIVSDDTIGYTQPACTNEDLQTAKITYSGTVTLDESYNDPAGYYISWQRCCRNYNITNIYSEPPPTGDPNYPFAAGQTFYMEFPPVVKNGKPFINSSPHLFPPLNDYGCPGRPYYVNFAGVDDDNDSLVYTMVTPLNTKTDDALPPAAPAPYPNITWRPGYSLQNIMYGQPDLHISSDGLLTVTPTVQGLFVFAVKVEQYRDKIKIGESRRDFQMLVVDGCEPDSPPQIVGKKLADPTFTYINTMAVSFANTVPDGSRCIVVRVSDPDSQSPLDDFTENVGIRVIPLNFSKNTDISGILPAVTKATLKNGSTVDFSICFPKCPFVDGPFDIGIIAFDDACSLPETDTLRVTVTIQPPPNTPPYFTTPNPVTAILNEGESQDWTFQAVDPDNDSIVVYYTTDGFNLADAGMTFTVTTDKRGTLGGTLHWDAFCDIYDFTQRTSFKVTVFVDDLDTCGFDNPVPAVYNLAVKLPGVAPPILTTDLTSDPQQAQVNLVRKINQSVDFNAFGTEADGDLIVLRDVGVNVDPPKVGATFPKATGNGSVTSAFHWPITCTTVNLKKDSLFEYLVVLVDSTSKCRERLADSVLVNVTVRPPDDAAPVLVIQSDTSTPVDHGTLSITLGEAIILDLIGTDTDTNPKKDSLELNLVSVNGTVTPKGYTFKNAGGLGSVESQFFWDPDCSIFKNGVYQNDYKFKFAVADNKCFNSKSDTVELEINVSDISNAGTKFQPPNVITPNGDGCNDFFALEGIDPLSGTAAGCVAVSDPDAEIALPKDNCQGHFQFIRIYDRWGKQVFESNDRKFRWYAQNATAGVYYYYIEFSNSKFKSSLSVCP
jgi:CHU_C Type IX secretion signal domain